MTAANKRAGILNGMAEYTIPDDVRKFILESIDSVAQLEALLLLRDSSGQQWSAAAVAKRLYISEQEAISLLTRLGAAGMIIASSDEPTLYSFQLDSPQLALIMDRLAETYSKHLVPITNLIHSKPRTRIQEFADAFKLRKED